MNSKSNITSWLTLASQQLVTAGISSGRLDAEIILAHTLRKSRTYLHAHGEDTIDSKYLDILDTRLALRLDRVPVAYIIGHKDFYGRSFKVTPATLIPRPESEVIIDLLKEAVNQPELPLSGEPLKLVDVGTGSGCLGITAKLEIPDLEVTLLDISRHALSVAEDNARLLQATVATSKSDLLSSYPFEANFVLANLPYVSENMEVSPETRHEPKEALYASNNGLSVIYRLLNEVSSRLAPQGILFIEADLSQHDAVIDYGSSRGFKLQANQGFILTFQLT